MHLPILGSTRLPLSTTSKAPLSEPARCTTAKGVLGPENPKHKQLGIPLSYQGATPPGLQAWGPPGPALPGTAAPGGVTLPPALLCFHLAQQLPFCGEEERGR